MSDPIAEASSMVINGYMLTIDGSYIPETFKTGAQACVQTVFASVEAFSRMKQLTKTELIPVSLTVTPRKE